MAALRWGVTCRLVLGTTELDKRTSSFPASAETNDSVPLTGVGTLAAPGDAQVLCKTGSGTGSASQLALTAIEVGAVH